jgi:hypothetical protein
MECQWASLSRWISQNLHPKQQADILLISESHFTTKSYIKKLNYTIYDTNTPAVLLTEELQLLLKLASNTIYMTTKT